MSEEQTHRSNPMLSSKKARAYLLGEITWKLLLLITFAISAYYVYQPGAVPSVVALAFIALQSTVVLVAGFLEVSYIGKQGDLDKFLGLAKIATRAGMEVGSDGTLKQPGEQNE